MMVSCFDLRFCSSVTTNKKQKWHTGEILPIEIHQVKTLHSTASCLESYLALFAHKHNHILAFMQQHISFLLLFGLCSFQRTSLTSKTEVPEAEAALFVFTVCFTKSGSFVKKSVIGGPAPTPFVLYWSLVMPAFFWRWWTLSFRSCLMGSLLKSSSKTHELVLLCASVGLPEFGGCIVWRGVVSCVRTFTSSEHLQCTRLNTYAVDRWAIAAGKCSEAWSDMWRAFRK